MRRRAGLGLSIVLVTLASWPGHMVQNRPNDPAPYLGSGRHSHLKSEVHPNHPNLPLSFEANRGQAHLGIRFLSRSPESTVLVSPRELGVLLTGAGPRKGSVLDSYTIRFLGTSGPTQISGRHLLQGRVNYFIG